MPNHFFAVNFNWYLSLSIEFFLSNPIIKNVTDIAQNNNVLGWTYDPETDEITEKVSNPGNGLAEI
jgi:carbonic anhydrase